MLALGIEEDKSGGIISLNLAELLSQRHILDRNVLPTALQSITVILNVIKNYQTKVVFQETQLNVQFLCHMSDKIQNVIEVVAGFFYILTKANMCQHLGSRHGGLFLHRMSYSFSALAFFSYVVSLSKYIA